MSDCSLMPNVLRERFGHKKRSVKKTVVVQYRASKYRASLFFRDWTTFKRYADLATAKQAMRSKAGDRYFEYRIKP